jgi:predicted aspartyl protease
MVKKFISFLFFLGMASQAFSQKGQLKTRDGLSLGSKSDFINACKEGAGKEFIEVEGVQLATVDYCGCVADKLIPKVDSRELILAVQEGNIVKYLLNDSNRPIVMECVMANMKVNPNFANIPEKSYSTNTYNPEEILSDQDVIEIPLTETVNSNFTLEIEIDGEIRSFILDTGASEMIINADMERELLLNGTISRENYLEKRPFKLANNQMVTAQLIRVNTITIGGCFVENAVIASIDDGELLLGTGFLKKFKSWELDSKNKVLRVYRK